MENIRSLNTYNTDTHSSWGIGQITKPSTWTFEDVLRYAINLEYTSSNKKLSSNDEIAIFPPVSG